MNILIYVSILMYSFVIVIGSWENLVWSSLKEVYSLFAISGIRLGLLNPNIDSGECGPGDTDEFIKFQLIWIQ